MDALNAASLSQKTNKELLDIYFRVRYATVNAAEDFLYAVDSLKILMGDITLLTDNEIDMLLYGEVDPYHLTNHQLQNKLKQRSSHFREWLERDLKRHSQKVVWLDRVDTLIEDILKAKL